MAVQLPTYDELMGPLLKALHELGGSASIAEMQDWVAEALKLPESEVSKLYRGNRTHFNYRLAWARQYLKTFGLITNSSRGVWSLTEKGRATKRVDKDVVKRFVKRVAATAATPERGISKEEYAAEERWQDLLIEAVLKLPPAAFERLCQRILRESGFTRVEVTGRSGDGGIDGRGIMRLAGLLSFHVFFQCKRYSGNVPSRDIRDFRGAMEGRGDKGLFLTTGTFSREAIKEAGRDGARQIDLVDGEQLAERMRELRLGISTQTEEVIKIDHHWLSEV